MGDARDIAAIARDASSGGVIRLVTIDGNGCERRMIQPIEQPPCDDELPQIKRAADVEMTT